MARLGAQGDARPRRSTSSTCAGWSANGRRPRPTRPARRTASSAGLARTPAATAGPTSGSAITSPGSTKGKRADLDAAFGQLRLYALALENPPLLIVSDMLRFRIRTNWTNSVSKTTSSTLDELDGRRDSQQAQVGVLGPRAAAAGRDAAIADRAGGGVLRDGRAGVAGARARPARGRALRQPARVLHVRRRRGPATRPHVHADAGAGATRPGSLHWTYAGVLCSGHGQGRVGRLRDGRLVQRRAVRRRHGAAAGSPTSTTVLEASDLDWSEIDPSILGTLFERGLDPDKRAQLGAHYTDRDKIMLIVEPVVIRPWLAEWKAEKEPRSPPSWSVRKPPSRRPPARSGGTRPSGGTGRSSTGCGRSRCSTRHAAPGNFLYLALQALKDLEHRVQVEAEALGLPAGVPGDRSGQRQGHRDQPVCRRVGPRVGLDRRDPVDASQRLLGSATTRS